MKIRARKIKKHENLLKAQKKKKMKFDENKCSQDKKAWNQTKNTLLYDGFCVKKKKKKAVKFSA